MVIDRIYVVSERKFLRDAITIRCACTHGDTVLYPVAQLDLEIEGMPKYVCQGCSVRNVTSVSLLSMHIEKFYKHI